MRWGTFLLIIISCTDLQAQVWVEIISRSDSFAFLGSNSDNRVRIHNLPEGATVKMEYGQAISVTDDEYILCKIHSPHIDPVAELVVTDSGRTLFRKTYKIIWTGYSGSVYNPVPDQVQVSLGHFSSGTVTIEEIKSVINEGLIINDTTCTITGATMFVWPKGCDFRGPFDVPCNSVVHCMLPDRLRNDDLLRSASTIIFENIKVQCPANKYYIGPGPIVLRVR